MYEKYRWLYKSIEKMSLNNPSTEHFNWFLWGGSLVEFFMLVAIVALLLYGVWYSTSPFLRFPVLAINTLWHGVFILSISLWLLGSRFSLLPSFILFKNNLLYDDFSFKISIILVICTIVCLFLSRDFLVYEKINVFEYVIFILLSCLGGCWLVASYDFFTMYLAIELLSLPLYALASIKSRSLLSTEAGLKYFILGAFSSGVFLFGVSLIYFATGSLNFAETGQLFAGTSISLLDLTQGDSSLSYVSAYLIGVIMVLVGLLFKLTAVPFHMWAPDVYEGAPTPVTAYFSIVPKLAVFAVTIRIFYVSFFDIGIEWQKALIFCSIASMILGTFGAMVQKLDLKRLLAYSAIANGGYMMLGLGASNLEGIQGLLLYAVVYIVMTFNAFATILTLRSSKSIAEQTDVTTYNWEQDHNSMKTLFYKNDEKLTTTDSEQLTWVTNNLVPRQLTVATQNSLGSLKGIMQFRCISKTNPLLAISIAFMFFSIAGVPPLAGFVGKMYLFFAAINGSLYLSVLVAILVNVVGSFYYIRCIKLAYFDQSKEWISLAPFSKEVAMVLGSTILFISFFFLYPTTTILWVQNASMVL